jgi:predicted nucleic acid-binding protein
LLNDCLIAAYCILNNLALLHHDRDFDPIEKHFGLVVVR